MPQIHFKPVLNHDLGATVFPHVHLHTRRPQPEVYGAYSYLPLPHSKPFPDVHDPACGQLDVVLALDASGLGDDLRQPGEVSVQDPVAFFDDGDGARMQLANEGDIVDDVVVGFISTDF